MKWVEKVRNIPIHGWMYLSFIAYVMLFLFSFFGFLTTIDEYDGGNEAAEIGASIFEIFIFPLSEFLSLIDGITFLKSEALFLIFFVLSLVVQFLILIVLINVAIFGVRKLCQRLIEQK
jgi:quinol-cytochrome oxidoreductase complex cytochrome b subunit